MSCRYRNSLGRSHLHALRAKPFGLFIPIGYSFSDCFGCRLFILVVSMRHYEISYEQLKSK
jgi:hypothetical protein